MDVRVIGDEDGNTMAQERNPDDDVVSSGSITTNYLSNS